VNSNVCQLYHNFGLTLIQNIPFKIKISEGVDEEVWVASKVNERTPSEAAPEPTRDALKPDLGHREPPHSCMPLLGGRYSSDRNLLLFNA